jgi:hypothetical protein
VDAHVCFSCLRRLPFPTITGLTTLEVPVCAGVVLLITVTGSMI